MTLALNNPYAFHGAFDFWLYCFGIGFGIYALYRVCDWLRRPPRRR